MQGMMIHDYSTKKSFGCLITFGRVGMSNPTTSLSKLSVTFSADAISSPYIDFFSANTNNERSNNSGVSDGIK